MPLTHGERYTRWGGLSLSTWQVPSPWDLISSVVILSKWKTNTNLKQKRACPVCIPHCANAFCMNLGYAKPRIGKKKTIIIIPLGGIKSLSTLITVTTIFTHIDDFCIIIGVSHSHIRVLSHKSYIVCPWTPEGGRRKHYRERSAVHFWRHGTS